MQSSYVVEQLATSRDDYEATWNRQADRQTDRPTDRQTDGQDHVLSQADALTKR